jgi:hypothetical protein
MNSSPILTTPHHYSTQPISFLTSTVMASISRSVAKKVLSLETSEGAGAVVRRSIGSPELRNLTPFLMLDHFHIGKGAVRDLIFSRVCV